MTENNDEAMSSKFQSTFNAPEGEEVLFHLMELSGWFEESHFDPDPVMNSFKQGMREFVRTIHQYLTMTEKDYWKRYRELTNSRQQEDDPISYIPKGDFISE